MSGVRLVVGTFDETVGTYPRTLVDEESKRELASAPSPGDPPTETLRYEEILNSYASLTGRSAKLAEIGTNLYAFLSQGNIGPCWLEKRSAGARSILDIQDPHLKYLPWELAKYNNQYLFKLSGSPQARTMGATPVGDTTSEWPLRVLVVVSESRGAPIDGEVEAKALERKLLRYGHSIDLQVLRDITYREFVSEIERFLPHVFLFIGHCLKDPVTEEYGLFLSSGAGAKYWRPTEIAGVLESKHWHPRFVLLNACRTADPEALEQNGAVISAFLAAGVPACVAMQGDIRGDVAATFSSGLLSRIAAGTPIDQAVAQARGDVTVSTDDADKQWSLPVLWLSLPPADIFPSITGSDKDVTQILEDSAMSREVRMFADRQHERRAIRQLLNPIVKEARAQHVVLMQGSIEIGKSHLLKCLGEALTVGRAHVEYLPLSSKQSLDVIGLIRLIRDGDPTYQVKQLARELFHRFHWDFRSIRESGVRKEWNHSACEDDLRYERTEGKSDSSIQMICTSFLEALNEAGKRQPVVLILDQFRNGNELAISKGEFRDFVWPYLLQPIRRGQYPSIRVILAMRDEDITEYAMDGLIVREDRIVLQPFAKKDYRRLASEYFWHVDEEDDFVSHILDLYQESLEESWSPKLLAILKEVTDRMCRDGSHMKYVSNRR